MAKNQAVNADEPVVEQATYNLPAGIVMGLTTARGELIKLHGRQILDGKAPLMNKKTQNELCRLVADFVDDLFKLKREVQLLKEQRKARREEYLEIHKLIIALGGRMTQDIQENP